MAQEKLPDITPQADVDENLFLVRVLESLYSQWPSYASDPDEFTAESAELRKEAVRFRQHIQRHDELDKALGARFTDFIAALDAYTDFLANISVIKAEAAKRQQQDSFQSGYEGGYAGAASFSTLTNSGYDTGDAAVISLVIGGLVYAADAWNRSNESDEAQKRAVDAEARRIGDRYLASLTQAQATARTLAKKHGWAPSEIGWELSDEEAQVVTRLLETNDWSALVRVLERQTSLRPRDAITHLSLSYFKALAFAEDSDILGNTARDLYATASLVPADGVYDDYRIACVSLAALIASQARLVEFQNGQAVSQSTANGQLAVSLWKKLLAMSPSDPTGEIREALAFALMGVNSLGEALQYANDVLRLREIDPQFCYNYACLLSRAGALENSLRWLDASIRQGYSHVAWAWEDPDLQRVRIAYSKEFAELLTPRWSWTVTDDWVWDDVTLSNESHFPLSNIEFSITLNKGARQETRKLTCRYLEPGKTKTWVDVVRGVEGVWDSSSTASLLCDQNRALEGANQNADPVSDGWHPPLKYP
ncbi:hypothetical protein H5P28_10255 [Ruficoccus amylovorans]|uniref:Tetratricopeptide repeat protein n=1 Tax=Ruficoccus amylovorans TaxID=1804625 RepID=A0A842HHC6_9BACT|nr:hypothetical protein [Ruficoccus amylovorans]MBC2594641.1 hypothetical protein [Ruficoccus amylovorans]